MFKQSLRMLSTSAKILGKVPTKNISVFQKNYNIAMKAKPMSFTYAPTFNFSKKIVKIPSMGDSITEGTVLEIKKNVGESVALDEVVAILETDKVQVEVRAPEAGVISAFFGKLEDTLNVGQNFFEIDTAGSPSGGAAQPKTEKKEEAVATPKSEAPKPEAPKAEAPKAEAPKAEAPKKVESKPAQQTSSPSASASVSTGERTERRERMSKMRQVISKRLKEAQNTTAMLTTFNEVDMSALMETRKELQEDFTKRHGVKLGFMSFFVKAATKALQSSPIVNAVISEDGKEIIHRNYIDISVAVATPAGLLVPVIRNCQNLNFADIEKTLLDLGARGKDNKIAPEELSGGTFTISNGGVFGSLMGTPIINLPQSAILGMHAVVNRPVVVKDQIVARPMMYLALTYDHRIIDGREAVVFLKKIKSSVEDPRRMLLDI
jgi:2-oxoglutarate dehydrogenase E2 component (dihydrolipoamide succinyltransferase)